MPTKVTYLREADYQEAKAKLAKHLKSASDRCLLELVRGKEYRDELRLKMHQFKPGSRAGRARSPAGLSSNEKLYRYFKYPSLLLDRYHGHIFRPEIEEENGYYISLRYLVSLFALETLRYRQAETMQGRRTSSVDPRDIETAAVQLHRKLASTYPTASYASVIYSFTAMTSLSAACVYYFARELIAHHGHVSDIVNGGKATYAALGTAALAAIPSAVKDTWRNAQVLRWYSSQALTAVVRNDVVSSMKAKLGSDVQPLLV